MYDKTTIRLITVMSIIGLAFSFLGAASLSLGGILMLCMIPAVLSILFLIKKRPIFGIAYTVFFFLNRISIILGGGTLLAWILIMGMLVFFIYVDRRCYLQWKRMKSYNTVKTKEEEAVNESLST